MGSDVNTITLWKMIEMLTLADMIMYGQEQTEVAQKFISRMQYDSEIAERNSDRLIKQPQWMRAPEIYTLWDSVGIEPPQSEWIDAYIDDYNKHQEYDMEMVNQLKDEYDRLR